MHLPSERHTSDAKGQVPWVVASPAVTDPTSLLHALQVLPESRAKKLSAVVRQDGIAVSVQAAPVVPQTHVDAPSAVWHILLVPLHSLLSPHLQTPPQQVCPEGQDVVSH